MIMKAMPTRNKDLVEIFAEIKLETSSAVLINDGDTDAWLPKSQIEIEDKNKYNQATILVPEWLANGKGLI